MMLYFFPLFFIGMWCLIIYMISKMGWADLVTHYQTDTSFVGERVGIISAAINNANYNRALVLKYNEAGMYLRPVLLFRLFHKPIFIPWKEIKEVREKKILFVTLKELIIGDPFVAIIKMKKTVYSRIEFTLAEHMNKPLRSRE